MKILEPVPHWQVELLVAPELAVGLVPGVGPEAPGGGLASPLPRGGGGGGGQAPLIRPPHHPGPVHDGQEAGGQGLSSLLAVEVDAVVLAESDAVVLHVGLLVRTLPSHSKLLCSPTMMCSAYSLLSLAFCMWVLASLAN